MRPLESEAFRTTLPTEALKENETPAHIPSNRMRDDAHQVLALSAGGADGAYGVGVLAGWTASGTRPDFDVVTGVSTGALHAVLAFLGPQYDALAKELYTTQTNDKVYRDRGVAGLLSDSLYDNTPLKKQIEKYVTADLLQKVATEHHKGRRLYVATTNLDAGELVIWDMGQIAAGGRANPLQHFQKVLRASSAVPGFFQPVYIKPQRGVELRQAHVDGGVKEPILYTDFMGQSTAPVKQLFLVVNGTMRRYNDSQPVESKLASIARKTIVELMREIQFDTIFRHYVSAKDTGMEFRVTSIPDEIPISNTSLNFDPKRMKQLFDAGFKVGARGVQAWSISPNKQMQKSNEHKMVMGQ